MIATIKAPLDYLLQNGRLEAECNKPSVFRNNSFDNSFQVGIHIPAYGTLSFLSLLHLEVSNHYVPGLQRHYCISSSQGYKEVDHIIFPILQIRKQRLKEVKSFAQDHTARGKQVGTGSHIYVTPKPVCHTTFNPAFPGPGIRLNTQ